ncbi:Olfactory receptor 7G1 [Sciurus carolinensis]|uniref:Olfactory receptor 7G1 n=1 Tax=Sciurus carolinensis TaxID=30640 RepID=A0AA41MGR0_SCICA|nr:Olfactory receptor 7G1 [Sciurus carolinensis]
MCLVNILGNLLIILAIYLDSHLHTPMYFFLCNLSFNDICINMTTIPKMLVNILTGDQSITYTGCLTQDAFVMISSYWENFLLAVMAYDCYVAIIHPLRYTVIMKPCLCVLLVMVSLFVSIVDALLHTLLLLRLSFCRDPEVPQFFSEFAHIIKLSCSDTFTDNLIILIAVCVFAGVPLSGIISSCIHIVSSVLRMPSSGGKQKAFSNCGSHLSVVCLFYRTGAGVYISSAMTDSSRKTAVVSVMYSVVPQILNPFIYSLRNRGMKVALRNLMNRIASV